MMSAAKPLEDVAGTRGTDSRLDDTDIDKNFGPDLPLLFIMHEIWSVDSQQNYWNCSQQMSNFKAKMHQNSISAGALPQTLFTVLPQTASWISGAYF